MLQVWGLYLRATHLSLMTFYLACVPTWRKSCAVPGFSSQEKATAQPWGITRVLKVKDWGPREQVQSYREAVVVMCSIICLSVCLPSTYLSSLPVKQYQRENWP